MQLFSKDNKSCPLLIYQIKIKIYAAINNLRNTSFVCSFYSDSQLYYWSSTDGNIWGWGDEYMHRDKDSAQLAEAHMAASMIIPKTMS